METSIFGLRLPAEKDEKFSVTHWIGTELSTEYDAVATIVV
jgi:hypothetical protein